MSRFPLFVDISGCDIIVCGSGPMLNDKLEKLKQFDAHIRLFTPDKIMPHHGMIIKNRLPQEDDFTPNVAFAVSAGCDEAESKRIYSLCIARNIPVNTADIPELCTFFFPSLIVRGECTVGISTNGASPAVSAALRRRIEDSLPDEFDEILEWSVNMRRTVRDRITDPALQRKIIRLAVDRAFSAGRPLTQAEMDSLIR